MKSISSESLNNNNNNSIRDPKLEMPVCDRTIFVFYLSKIFHRIKNDCRSLTSSHLNRPTIETFTFHIHSRFLFSPLLTFLFSCVISFFFLPSLDDFFFWVYFPFFPRNNYYFILFFLLFFFSLIYLCVFYNFISV